MKITTQQIAGIFLLVSSSTWALLPPKYLSVPEWQSCVGSMTKESARFVCLPVKKPDGCSVASWDQLSALNELERCPCSEN